MQHHDTLSSPMMLDVDTGVDDALAVALAVSIGANLVGISTVAGNVLIDLATGNTTRVLSWMGAESVPVHRGASRPLVADYYAAADVHGENGLGGADLGDSHPSESRANAVDALLANADRFDGELVVVALGPLTNIAMALSLRPRLVQQIRKLVVMGGAYEVSGNITPHAEFNVFADPHAGGQVFSAGWNEIVAVGLDVTHQTIISRDQWAGAPDGSTGAAGLVRRITGRTFTERQLDGFFLHDPLAVAVALQPDLVVTTSRSVDVMLTGEYRGKTTLGDGHVRVAMSVDATRFETLFAERMGIPIRSAQWSPGRAE